MDGTRKFGYGIDVLRAWCAYKDTDKNMLVLKEHLDQVNKEIKIYRDVVRMLLSYVQTYNVPKEKFNFLGLTIVDKMMMIRILEFS